MTDTTTTEAPETTEEEQVTPVPVEPEQEDVETAEGEQEDAETFSREYVEKLRKEAAEARVRAKRSDDLTAALWAARVTATGRLADPSDLALPEGVDPLDDDALTTAVDELLGRKPHLASRKPSGDIGQGATAVADTVDLAGILRSRA